MVRTVIEQTKQVATHKYPLGKFVRISPDEVAVSDLSAFREIHRITGGFSKSDWYLKFNDNHDNPGLFSMVNPKQHAQRRKLFAQSFSNSSILKFEDIVRGKVDLAVAKIKRDAKAGTADILKWFTFMATDAIGQLSFGQSFDMLQKETV